ncbi:hypothetical protein SDJN02_04556 [Cucurbita argyrosperma subsp. argyrosperma]|uniref:Uncharacterized protein LOC111432975 n=1 Tax=Cucurbita moschata TaxID=3662 RepID=A0A6J1EC37_CUCMO|nr:uncharacterized protein LOC111432975 [Cucurbita moschata]KAG7034824.1 hypothetical protein SDJN02_04556 [Cucurbita argyrosperma subsp. argyrosperma]
MPPELPGYYYDVQKNRYFPLKGPIPGSSRTSSSSSSAPHHKRASKPTTMVDSCSKADLRAVKLIQARELYGNVIASSKGKWNFKEKFQNLLASKPVVWKYRGTGRMGDSALQEIPINVHTLEGQMESTVLLTGNISGSLSFFGVGEGDQHIERGVNCCPELVWPLAGENQMVREVPGDIWQLSGASLQMSSNISSIKLFKKRFPLVHDDVSDIQHALISTLGSDSSGGSVYVLNLVEPLDFNRSIPVIRRRIHEVASFNCSIWTADCESSGGRAVIGTNMGAASVDMETSRISWILHGKSDIFALQLIHSENVVLCGLRNGMIVTIDTRERQGVCKRLVRHRIPYLPVDRDSRTSSQQWYKLTGNIYPSCTVKMPSSISSLVSLQFDDRYFLSSSMDGSVRLYDHRLIQRGAVQTYDRHANSHTRIQLGVDPTETFVASGGEDCNFRLWNIKSGKLIFEDKFVDAVPSTICWRRAGRFPREQNGYLGCGDHSWGAWLGSQGGLHYVSFPRS